MRLAILVGLGLLGLVVARPGAAAPFDYNAQLTVNFGALAPVVSGPVAGTTDVGVGGGFTLPAGIFTFSTLQVLPTPTQVATVGPFAVFLTAIGVNGANATGNLNTSGVGTLSIQGNATLFVTILGFPGPAQSIPLTGAFGVPGATTLSLGFGATAMIAGQSFVPGTVMAATTLPTGTGPTSVTMTGSGPTATPMGGVNMSLVTATQVVTNTPSFTAVFGQLQIALTPVPEPGSLLLVGAGLVGLFVAGRRAGL